MNKTVDINLEDYAKEIASHLDNWELSKIDTLGVDDRATFKMPSANGESPEVQIRLPSNPVSYLRGKFVIYGLWPSSVNGYYFYPKKDCQISVSVNRGPKTVAREIETRFLPVYLENYYELLREKNELVKYVEAKAALMRQLAAVAGELHKTPGGEEYVEIPLFESPSHCRITHSSRDQVNMEIKWIPSSLALELAAILAHYQRNRSVRGERRDEPRS